MSWFLLPVVLLLIWFIGYQVYNAIFPERGTTVQVRPAAAPTQNTPPARRP